MTRIGKGNPKLSSDDVIDIRTRHDAGAYGKDLAIEYGVDPSSISDIVRGRSHRGVGGPIAGDPDSGYTIPERTSPGEPRTDWLSDAACRDTDPEVWFPKSGRDRDLEEFCGHCPVRRECAADALATRVEYGIRAGVALDGGSASTRSRQRARLAKIAQVPAPVIPGGPQSRLTDRQIVAIRVAYATGKATQGELGRDYGVSGTYVSHIVLGARRPHAGGPISKPTKTGGRVAGWATPRLDGRVP